ncbi:MAG TPA: DUF1257 domain-containing protein [Pirellulales bacterium]|nr:DUF1257 domain-containing protein [Pirellulales bacterium]
MSHIVEIKTEVRDPDALRAACRRLGLAELVHETVQLFSGKATGWAVRLPDWNYPVVFDTTRGEARYDNFNGRWGEQKHLDRLMQAYAIEKSRRSQCASSNVSVRPGRTSNPATHN